MTEDAVTFVPTDRAALDEAVTLSGRSMQAWLDQAVREQIQRERDDSLATGKWKPGPWPGWTTLEDKSGHVEHNDGNGRSVLCMPHGWSFDSRRWAKASSRPWTARNDREDAPLKTKDGKIRVFATAEAARAALDRA